MVVPVMAISNLVLTQQIYSEETNGAHAHYREPVPLKTEHPQGTAQVDFVTFIVQSYFNTLLRYVLSVTFCGAVVSEKVMDQNFNDTR